MSEIGRNALRFIVFSAAIFSAPRQVTAQATNPYEALADALTGIIERIADEALELEFDRELQRLAPVLERDLCGKAGGAIVFADMYSDAGGSARRLRGLVPLLGQCPAEAFGNLEGAFANGYFAALPPTYGPDLEHSFGLWVTCPGQTIRTWQTITWPAWALMADAQDPSCPEFFLTQYSIRATVRGLGPGLSVVEYVVTDRNSASVLVTFEERIPMELELGERRYRSVALPNWVTDWSEAEWRQYVLNDARSMRRR